MEMLRDFIDSDRIEQDPYLFITTCSGKIVLDIAVCILHRHVKLSCFYLYHVTNNGSLVSFPIGQPMYFSPELVARGPYSKVASTPKVSR